MKTPEEMAEEYRKAWGDAQLYKIRHEHKRFEWSDALVDGFLAGYQAAKNETNLPKPAQWISVKDRLPEILENDYSNPVLLLRTDRFIVIGRIEKCVRFVRPLQEALIVETDNGDPIEEFTHWMPLPEPPKEEKLITSLDQIYRPQKRISVEEAREMFPDKPPKEEK